MNGDPFKSGPGWPGVSGIAGSKRNFIEIEEIPESIPEYLIRAAETAYRFKKSADEIALANQIKWDYRHNDGVPIPILEFYPERPLTKFQIEQRKRKRKEAFRSFIINEKPEWFIPDDQWHGYKRSYDDDLWNMFNMYRDAGFLPDRMKDWDRPRTERYYVNLRNKLGEGYYGNMGPGYHQKARLRTRNKIIEDYLLNSK